MKKKVKIGIVSGGIIIVGFILFCLVNTSKRTEIVWYLTDPLYYGVEENKMEPYQEIHSERFDRFNRRLKELEIPAKVVFKYMPGDYGVPEGADIVKFSPLKYKEFVELDTYFEENYMKMAKEALPPEIWDVSRIHGKTYQIPRGSVNVRETIYSFYKPFLEQYQIEIDENKIKQMTPKEVLDWLYPYFEKERILDERYRLAAAEDLSYEFYFLGKKIPLLYGTANNLWLDVVSGKVQDAFSTGEMEECISVYQWIYKNNIDAHENPYDVSPISVFRMGSIPSMEQLQGNVESDWVEVGCGNRHLASPVGNAVPESSQNKELAVKVLAASIYDEGLTNIMIYGIEGKDYELKDGHALYLGEQAISPMGSFSEVGNNLIAYPNEMEILDKREKTGEILKNIETVPFSNFTPLWEEADFEKIAEIAAIYDETMRGVMFSEIFDVQAYLEKQREKIKEAGVEKIIEKIQKQVNEWEE